ncbi:RING zinc finger-containing protein [Cavenderia fasciculata]|uniref:RING zinc finger-containing protein n=1 Tax=Cavenderia fasciculata TaxID=261658 RepID=F4PQR0_CACFS|nr:RING zinc finger-containing protein [Cavenderia fasciculata]EGG22018.1 RING zinc finger-containing protein [Cavenderia fasciculata]|eukprot:XP_004359869.1 RING zinc finger-containing protein [Cavenderia fasciculata]
MCTIVDEKFTQAMSDDERESITIEQRVVNQSDLDALTCSICLSLMTSPVKQCISGHLGCQSCLEKVSTCPQCRVPISNGGLSRSLITDHMLSSLRIHCENQFRYDNEQKKWVKDEKGCPKITTVATSDTHKLTCKFNLLQCENQGCDEQVLKKDMDSHLEQCKHQQEFRCPFNVCQYTGKRKELDQHILNDIAVHISNNNYEMDCQIELLNKTCAESIESLKVSNNKIEILKQKIKSLEITNESQNQLIKSQIESLQQQFKSLETSNGYVDQKVWKCKEKTKEMIKHTTVHSEWVIENFGKKYKSKTDEYSDDFKMGGFDWYICLSLENDGQVGFYVFLHNNPGKLVKTTFTLQVSLPRSQSHIQQFTNIYDHEDSGAGYYLDSETYLKEIQDTDCVTVQFKGFVAKVSDDPDIKK